MTMLQNANAISAGGYDINNSLRFRSSASAYLSRTMSASGTTATFSFWVKRGTLGVEQAIFLWSNGSTTSYGIEFNANDTLTFLSYSSAFVLNLTPTQVFRDPSAWYHIVCVQDTTQATASNRAKLYVNGTQVTAFSTATYPAQNTSLNIASSNAYNIGRSGGTGSLPFDGYMAEFNFIDGQALTPSSFGSTNALTGVWQPAKYTGTYGTNGFYLKFSNIALTSGSNTGLGQDYSGNGNYWNTNNISVTAGTTYDAMTDVPTLTSATVANYCVKNPLVAGTGATITGANLNSTGSTTTFANARATFTLSSGKWYWEETITGSSIYDVGIGLVLESSVKSASNTRQTGWYDICNASAGQVASTTNGGAFVNISTTDFATNDVIMVAYDADTGYIWFGKNGTWYPASTGGSAGNPAAGTNQTITAVSGLIPSSFHYNTNAGTASNFGQRAFSYTPPTGFVALNTYNLPTSTIVQGNKYMDATLYTGNLIGQSITNAGGFKPDLVWIKSRSAATDHKLTDSNRGATKALISDSTAAETTDLTGLTAFNTNGFTIGADTNYNNTSATYVGWQWQAGQGTTSSNTSGSITSTVSVNTTAGFSVVTYTGTGANATVGHGLGVAPKWVIVKSRSLAGQEWQVYSSDLGNTKYMLLNSTSASTTSALAWNNTSPTSTTVSLGTGANANSNGATYVAYCWAEIAGFSKFGSYTGNGSTDGPFVYTGFRPKFILIKRTDSAANWYLFDTSRNTYNVMKDELLPNSTNSEADNTRWVDALSNGFKIRNDNVSQINANGATMIYMAFAESPFKNSLAR